MTRQYELCCLLRSDVTKRSVEEIQKKVESLVKAQGGKMKGFDQWASMPLAFPVKKEKKGVYTFTQFEVSQLNPDSLNTFLMHHDNVLRHEVFHMEDDYDYVQAKKNWMLVTTQEAHFDPESPAPSHF